MWKRCSDTYSKYFSLGAPEWYNNAVLLKIYLFIRVDQQ